MLHNLKNAVQENDSNKVSTYIDFASVRQNLKDQIHVYVMQKTDSSNNHHLKQLENIFSTSMIEKIVDLAVTPEGVTKIMQGKKPNDPTNDSRNTSAEKTYTTRYLSFNQFEVSIHTQDKFKNITMILERQNLSWKVTKINIPINNR